MLTFFTTNRGSNYPETRFECPYCKHELNFWGLSPKVCSMCYQDIPFDANKMVKNMGIVRAEYHVGDNQISE